MIEWRYNYSTEKLLNHQDSETVSFFRHYLSYLSQVKLDDFSHLTEEDFKFYNKVSFEISLDNLNGRENLYQEIVEDFHTGTGGLKLKYPELFHGGFSEFNHWMSVVSTRVRSQPVK